MAAALALPPPSPSTFADLMIWLTPVMTLGKITQPQMIQALADLGGLPGLATRQDLIPMAFARLHALVAP